MTTDVHAIHATTSAAAPHPVLAWLAPRLGRDAPVPAGTARLLGLVVHDPTYGDPDVAARAAWIGDGTCPGQVMADHAADLARYDLVVSVTWHADGPEAVLVLVNP
jgi:hypothetical protein